VAKDFDKGAVPLIPGPIDDPPLFQSFRTPEMGLSKLMARIQAPNHPDYPMLARIGSGSYICTVSQRWSDFSAEKIRCEKYSAESNATNYLNLSCPNMNYLFLASAV
jgi:hypothetical protein